METLLNKILKLTVDFITYQDYAFEDVARSMKNRKTIAEIEGFIQCIDLSIARLNDFKKILRGS